jgi:hypothetical protein
MNNKIHNEINILHPYQMDGAWIFDDPEIDIHGQPIICGIPGVINKVMKGATRFTVHISQAPFQNYNTVLVKLKDSDEGWYKFINTDIKGWLCPAFLKYFPDYPDEIYLRIEHYSDPLSN